MNDKIKDQALKICKDIFDRYEEAQLSMFPELMFKAWQVGKRYNSLINKDVEAGQAESCAYSQECSESEITCMQPPCFKTPNT